jgi:hypothetical protein
MGTGRGGQHCSKMQLNKKSQVTLRQCWGSIRIRIRIHIFILMRIRILPFTQMRIWIRIRLFADSYPDPVSRQMRVCDHWSTDPPRPHFGHLHLHFEHLWPLNSSSFSLHWSWIFTLMGIRVLLWTLMRIRIWIRIQLHKMIRIHLDADPQHCFQDT